MHLIFYHRKLTSTPDTNLVKHEWWFYRRDSASPMIPWKYSRGTIINMSSLIHASDKCFSSYIYIYASVHIYIYIHILISKFPIPQLVFHVVYRQARWSRGGQLDAICDAELNITKRDGEIFPVEIFSQVLFTQNIPTFTSIHEIIEVLWICFRLTNVIYKHSPVHSYTTVLAPVPLSIFRSNSKFDENSERSSFKYIRPITTIFCTRHDSDTVVTCAKYRCDRPRIGWENMIL